MEEKVGRKVLLVVLELLAVSGSMCCVVSVAIFRRVFGSEAMVGASFEKVEAPIP